MPVIEVEHLTKRYRDHVAVHDVSFQVTEGEIFGILGPNGSGKTTTVECVQGLRQPDGGTVRVLGLDPQRQTAALRRRIGSQLQESALPDRIRVWEALDLFASLSNLQPRGRTMRKPQLRGRSVAPGGSDWRTLLDQWGLTSKRNASFAGLSGGQRQRLFVALALVNTPQIVFLDELTQGLDPGARRVAWSLIREIRDRGATVVLVTHYMDEAEELCDRLAIVDGGRVTAVGTPRELIASSGRPITVRFSTDHADLAFLDRIGSVDAVERRGPAVRVAGTGPVLAEVAAALVSRGIVPSDLHTEQVTLEDAFLTLTGHQPDRDTGRTPEMATAAGTNGDW